MTDETKNIPTVTLEEWKSLVKEIGLFGLIVGIILVYGPENLFGFLRRILSYVGLKAKVSVKNAFAWILDDGSEAAKLLNEQLVRLAQQLARLTNIAVMMIVAFFVLITFSVWVESKIPIAICSIGVTAGLIYLIVIGRRIPKIPILVGFIVAFGLFVFATFDIWFERRMLIVIYGVAVALYLFVYAFIVEKSILGLGVVLDTVSGMLNSAGSLIKAIAEKIGIELESSGNFEKRERWRDTFKDLRFLPIPFIFFTAVLAAFPDRRVYIFLFAVTAFALTLAFISYWKRGTDSVHPERWVSNVWYYIHRTVFVFLILGLIGTPLYFAFPKAFDTGMNKAVASVYGWSGVEGKTKKKIKKVKKQKVNQKTLDQMVADALEKQKEDNRLVALKKAEQAALAPKPAVQESAPPVIRRRSRVSVPRQVAVQSRSDNNVLVEAATEALKIKEKMRKELEALEKEGSSSN